MNPSCIYPGLAVEITRLWPVHALGGTGAGGGGSGGGGGGVAVQSEALKAREVGAVCRIERPYAVKRPEGGHMLWWLLRQDGRYTVCEADEFEPAEPVRLAVVQALDLLIGGRLPASGIAAQSESMHPHLLRQGRRTFKSQREAFEAGMDEVWKLIRREAKDLICKIDPWEITAENTRREG